MSKFEEFRVIVQKPSGTKNKYYPTILSGNTDETFPWSCPTARIDIATNVSGGTSGYMSPVRVDDIVRLQINTKQTANEKTVWHDLFEGRISAIESTFGQNNNSTLICRGHSEECLYSAVTADYSAGSTRTGAILEALRALHLTRITDASPSLNDTTASSVLTSYNIQEDSKYMADAVREMEALESYGYVFKTVQAYDSSGDLTGSYLSWQPVSSTASTKVQAIEGTTRLLEARFKSSAENILNDITVYGQDPGTQKKGTASDATSKAAYDSRYHVETDLNLTTDALCSAFAAAILARWKDPVIRGYLKLTGSYGINAGDLIYCKIPSLEINGASIDGNYRVRRVTHTIDSKGWFTHLDVGELDLTVSDMIAGFHTKMRLDNANLIS